MTTTTVAKRKLAFRPDDGTNLVEAALEAVSANQGQDQDTLRQAMRHGDCTICDAVRYQLAQKLAADLGAVDRSVKAVYLYEPEQATTSDEGVRDRPSLSPGLSLIIWVDRKTAALNSIVDSLGSAVSAAAKPLSCPFANALCWMVDAQFVDDRQVEQRLGYGALINSVYVRPIEVWQR